MHTNLVALALLCSAGTAAADVQIALPMNADANVITITYSCEVSDLVSVQYINSGANVLTIMPIDGEDRVFVNVASGSGAKYVSGSYIWWTKGDTATLEDTLQGNSLQHCIVQDNTSVN